MHNLDGNVPSRELAPKSRDDRAVKFVRKRGRDSSDSRLSRKFRSFREAGGSVARPSKIVLVSELPCKLRDVSLAHWLRSSLRS